MRRILTLAVPLAVALSGCTTVDETPTEPSDYAAEGYRVAWTVCGVGIALIVMLLAGPLAKRAPKD